MALGDPTLDPLLAFGQQAPVDPVAAPWPPPTWGVDPTAAPVIDPFATPDAPDPVAPDPFAPISDEIAGDPGLPPWEQPMPDVPAPAPEPALHEIAAFPGLTIREDVRRAAPEPLSFLAPGDPEAPLPSLQQEHAVDPFAEMSDADAFRASRNLAVRDPVAFEELQAQHALVKQRKGLAEQLRIEDENIRRIEANRKMREDAAAKAQADTDAIIAEATALASQPVDRKRWFTRQDTAGKIGAVIGALTGGLMSKAGGPNQGIDFIQKLVDDDIADQKYEIENKKDVLRLRQTAVGQAYARSGDLYQAAEVARIATYDALTAKLKTEQQNFDPRGTMFMTHGKTIQQMQAARAKAEQDLLQRQLENRIKVGEFELKRQERIDANARHARSLDLQREQLAEQRAQRKDAADARAAERAAEKADKEAERVRQFSVSAPRAAIQLDDKGKPVIGPDGKPVTTTQQFVNKDGKPWLLGDAESTRTMKDKVAAASEITDMIDEVLDIRSKVGGEIMPWSDAKQRLNMLQERLRLVRKSGTQGMSSDKDFEALGASIGAKNLTSFIDQSPGLKSARDRTVAELNTQMRTHNYDGPPISFANKYVGATNTPEDERRKGVVKKQDVSLDDAIRQNIDRVTADRGYGIDINDPADQALYQSIVAATQRDYQPGATKVQADDIAGYGRAAATGDAAALSILREVAASGETATLRRLAKEQIDALTPKPTPRGPRSEGVTVPDELRLP